jgi:hypothetical protein
MARLMDEIAGSETNTRIMAKVRQKGYDLGPVS